MDSSIAELVQRLPEGLSLAEALRSRGITEEKLREDTRRDIRLRKVVERRAEAVPETGEAEIEAFYEETRETFTAPERIHARHILVTCDPTADHATRAGKRAQADALKIQLDAGADFALLAEAHSECPSKSSGGDLGFLTRGQTVPRLDQAVFGQAVNEIGPVVESIDGFHVVQVLGREAERPRTLAEVHDEIAEQLLAGRREKALAEFVEGLKTNAVITYATNP